MGGGYAPFSISLTFEFHKMLLIRMITENITRALHEHSVGIGAGSMVLGQIQNLLFTDASTNLGELMKLMANITSIVGLLVVLLTFALKLNEFYGTFIAKRKAKKDKTDE